MWLFLKLISQNIILAHVTVQIIFTNVTVNFVLKVDAHSTRRETDWWIYRHTTGLLVQIGPDAVALQSCTGQV